MDLKVEFKKYADKVYGCWLGKALAGNIGAPYEGMKQKLSVKYNREKMLDMKPNDDLDLQALWLDVLERRGASFTSDDLAEAFYTDCPYHMGEYAYFKKNYAKGIRPPYSGSFNNNNYKNGMGCPIRSEIWACAAAGDSAAAAEYAARDGILDHDGDSVYAEQFLAALEASAFIESDIKKLIEGALIYLPEGTRIRRAVEDTLEWAAEGGGDMRDLIINRYGGGEATSIYVNIPFTIAALLLGGGDFIQTVLTAVNYGFDTDCTAATAGAVLGIIQGGAALERAAGCGEVTFTLGVNAKNRGGTIRGFAADAARICAAVMQNSHPSEGWRAKPDGVVCHCAAAIEYLTPPAVSFGGESRVKITFKSPEFRNPKISVTCAAPLELSALPKTLDFENGAADLTITARVPANSPVLPAINRVNMKLTEGAKTFEYGFGFSGSRRFLILGPYWKNMVDVPYLRDGENYCDYIRAKNDDDFLDILRHYHMCTLPDECENRLAGLLSGSLPSREFIRAADIDGDEIVLEDHARFDGQANYYLVGKFTSGGALACGLQIGYTDAFAFYLNGELLASGTEPNYYTPENIHKSGVRIKKGENTVFIKLTKRALLTKFSYDFVEGGACSKHLIEFAHVNPSHVIK